MGIKQGEVNKHKKSGIMYAAVFLVTVLVYTVIAPAESIPVWR